jgi:hypothetical protein
MVESGVHSHEAMALLGMETPSIFERYDIIDTERMKGAVKKTKGVFDTKSQRKVVGLRSTSWLPRF